ncbi:MAG: peptidyl-tRNA hydrolase Pth2 [Nanoarchaeota archaeon]
MTTYKQTIMVRTDLKLPKGKMATQVAHASVEAVLKAPSSDIRAWRSEGMKKVVVKVADDKDLYKHIQMAKDEGLVTSVITDAGKTVIAPGTVTCGAIGPAKEDAVDGLTQDLKLV